MAIGSKCAIEHDGRREIVIIKEHLLEARMTKVSFEQSNLDDLVLRADKLAFPYEHRQSEQKHDPVNSPSHYTKGKIETIDFIEATGLGFHLGNAVKYLSRAGLKGNLVEDLKKARRYVQRAMSRNVESREIRTGDARDDIAGYLERYVMTKQLSGMQYDALGSIVDGHLNDAIDTITRHIGYLEADKI